jgi:hypothetical protein
MPTQDEIDDILAKTAAYQEKKAVSDAAVKLAETSSSRANASRSAWDAVVLDGEDDATKLTELLTAVETSALDATAKATDAQTKQDETNTAKAALDNAIYAITNPPPPELLAAARPGKRKDHK